MYDKWKETEHSLRRKGLDRLRARLDNEDYENPTCFGWNHTKICLHGQEVVRGWAGEPGSYDIHCHFYDECEEKRQAITDRHERELEEYHIEINFPSIIADDVYEAFYKGVIAFLENPNIRYSMVQRVDPLNGEKGSTYYRNPDYGSDEWKNTVDKIRWLIKTNNRRMK